MHLHLDVRLNRSAPTTLVGQIVDGITRLVTDGRLRPGDRLPPTRALARDLRTTRGTIVAAYEQLLANGTLEAHVGRGTFVAHRTDGAARPDARSTAPAPEAAVESGPRTARAVLNPLPLVPESDGADGSPAGPRESNGAARGAQVRAFWDGILGGPARHTMSHAHDALDEWLSRTAPEAISFAYAIPPAELFPLTEFRRASDKALLVRGRELLQLGPAEGLPALRREIAARMTREGTPTAPDDVLVTTGCQQALDLVRRILVRPGDSVVLEEPTYPGAIHLFRAAGASLVPWRVTDQGWQLDELAGTLRERRVRLIYAAPDFHNPTGRTMDLAARRRLVALAAEHGVPIVEDGITTPLRYRGAALPTLRALDRHGVVLSLGSFSKTTFPGVRLGWIAAAPSAREHLIEAKQQADLQTSGPTQAAMYEVARSGALDRHVERVRREYVRRRDALDAALKRHLPAGCAWTLPDGGLSLWLTLPSEVDADRFAARAYEARVIVSSGRFFHAGRPREQAIRLAFALNAPDVAEEGARRMGRVLAATLAERRAGGRRRDAQTRTALV